MDEVRARRCTLCSINYPATQRDCLICKGVLWSLYRPEAEPDDDWQEKVRVALGYEPSPDAVYKHPPDGRCPVYKHGGRVWFKHDDLLGIGYQYLEEGSIVYVNDAFHELQFFWPKEKSWSVVVLPHEGVFDDATPEDFT